MQAELPASLPTPDPDSARHSDACARHIAACIEDSGGSISFARYMHEALYAPGLGYYAAGATKFGTSGDFVTAPEVSPLFGRVIARQCAPVLESIGGDLLEIGAGSGRLAVAVLRKLDELGTLPGEYRILEVSADLQDRQAALIGEQIPELRGRVRWIEALPQQFSGVVLANEVLDALPVERFVRRDAVRQLRVTNTASGFAFDEAPAPDMLAAAVAQIEANLGARLSDGYMSEVSLAIPPWIRDVLASLREGLVLLFDYGLPREHYYAPDRANGWLRCHFRHRAHDDPLILPGIQDITSWVDFSAVINAAELAGADIEGLTTQAHFLLHGGLDAEMQNFTTLSQREQLELSAQVKKLTLPGEMGEHFKCLGLSKGLNVQLDAFRSSR
ncbi:MAG: SAM-dependent methyltransferase [Woeseiaceae bacterium]|nr:SAM-dependent methyltransferase [Woeseiaceae bacterium]